jgi:predicted nuclease of predicted toxin-antitoxin system
MRLKIDENLPLEVTELLRHAGHDALSVLEQGLGGHADPDVANVCAAEGRGLVTLDVDFANVRRYPPSDHHGLIVLRLGRQRAHPAPGPSGGRRAPSWRSSRRGRGAS